MALVQLPFYELTNPKMAANAQYVIAEVVAEYQKEKHSNIQGQALRYTLGSVSSESAPGCIYQFRFIFEFKKALYR